MPLRLTGYAVDDDGSISEFYSRELTAHPHARATRPVFFGARDGSGALRARAGQNPFFYVDDDETSLVQGAVEWGAGIVSVTNLSSNRTMEVRNWGMRSDRVEMGSTRGAQDARMVIDVLDAPYFLVAGPSDPFEKGWSTPPRTSMSTPSTESTARDRYGPLALCACRLTGRSPERCEEREHSAREGELLTFVVVCQGLALWPQGRHAYVPLGNRGHAAERFGIGKSAASRKPREYLERLKANGAKVPEMDAPDLLDWLVSRGVLTFDDVSDLVESISV